MFPSSNNTAFHINNTNTNTSANMNTKQSTLSKNPIQTPNPSFHTASTQLPPRALHTGLFQDEKALQFLYIMKDLGESCLLQLHQVAGEGINDREEYIRRFQAGLDSISNWTINIRADRTQQAIRRYPDIYHLHQYTFCRYLKEIYKHEKPTRITINMPLFQDFLHMYYIHLSKNPTIRKVAYFDTLSTEREFVHIEALRATYIESVRVSMYSLQSWDPLSPLNAPINTQDSSLGQIESDVTPFDSISQVSFAPEQRSKNSFYPPKEYQHQTHQKPPFHKKSPHSSSLSSASAKRPPPVKHDHLFNSSSEEDSGNDTDTENESDNEKNNHQKRSSSPPRPSFSSNRSSTEKNKERVHSSSSDKKEHREPDRRSNVSQKSTKSIKSVSNNTIHIDLPPSSLPNNPNPNTNTHNSNTHNNTNFNKHNSHNNDLSQRQKDSSTSRHR